MAKWPARAYEVGFGRPPLHSRFKSGVSGNPRGRPKGTKNLQTDVLEEIREKITVREGEKARSISKQRAIVKAVVMRALKGDTKAISTLVSLLLRFQEPVSSELPDADLAVEDRAILDRFVARSVPEHASSSKKQPSPSGRNPAVGRRSRER